MSCRFAAFLRERNDGQAFWDRHAFLFRVGHKGSTRCLCSIALFPAEVGVSWTVSAPRPERHPTPHELETCAVPATSPILHHFWASCEEQ